MMSFITECCRFVVTFLSHGLSHARLSIAAIALMITLVTSQSVFAVDRDIYVKAGASQAGDGATWNSAFRELQVAIEAARTLTTGEFLGDTATIHVTEGVYYPDRHNESDPGDATEEQEDTFMLYIRVTMLGGYSASGASRNPAIYKSYLDGDIDEDEELNATNTYHIVTGNDSNINTTNCVFDGFTIRNGNANFSTEDLDINFGGGVYLSVAHPKIYNCTFSNNSARRGGGIQCRNTSTPPEIRNCRFIANVATGSGGKGAGVDGNHSAIVINCLFQNNNTGRYGAMNVENSSDQNTVKVINCRFLDNLAEDNAAGLWITGGYGQESSVLEVTNCLFDRNSTTNDPNSSGGAMYTVGNGFKVSNCTFVPNSAVSAGGAWYHGNGLDNNTATNCIFYGNSASDGKDVVINLGGDMTISYCASEQTLSGTGNLVLTSHPFMSYSPTGTTNNYRLLCGSPCIDAGLNSAAVADTQNVDEDSDSTTEKTPDLDLKKRIVQFPADDTNDIDMGCYEVQLQSPCTTAQPGDCVPVPCTDGRVNVDDLLMVLTSWGNCPDDNGVCPGDVQLETNYRRVNVDDLLLVITNWSEQCFSGSYNAGSMNSVEDCMDAATEIFEPYSNEWYDKVDKCVTALCEAEIIECD